MYPIFIYYVNIKMLGFSWSELLVVVAVAVFVIGPKDIPKVMYGIGRVVRRLQYVRFALSQQFDDVLKAGDIDELRRGVNFGAPATDEKSADEPATRGDRHDGQS